MERPQEGAITADLHRWASGDRDAFVRALAWVYGPARSAAGAMLSGRAQIPMGPTDLVHEVMVKALKAKPRLYNNREHFFRTTVLQMRSIFADSLKRARRKKAGGGVPTLPLTDDADAAAMSGEPVDATAFSRAMEQLERYHPTPAAALRLICWEELTQEQAAAALELSRGAAYRDVHFALSWLRREIRRIDGDDET